MPTLSADGDTATYQVKGETRVHCSGTFGSGTITWKYLGSDGSYHALANGAFSSASDKSFNFPDGVITTIKGTLGSSTGPSLFYDVSNHAIREV